MMRLWGGCGKVTRLGQTKCRRYRWIGEKGRGREVLRGSLLLRLPLQICSGFFLLHSGPGGLKLVYCMNWDPLSSGIQWTESLGITGRRVECKRKKSLSFFFDSQPALTSGLGCVPQAHARQTTGYSYNSHGFNQKHIFLPFPLSTREWRRFHDFGLWTSNIPFFYLFRATPWHMEVPRLRVESEL